ncbi:putative allantoicase [Rhodococcus sp. RD6.2]|uniref:allantoicase n=1 Tax=Rhodococcus sp. RD6.2 TaxID=260936 RepID=UPI00063B920D|nr:allantoicase [Rhodococcus sp. RD6.2]CRK51671.1 putative allantoicase [Rhodococcus sp. RD6.2]
MTTTDFRVLPDLALRSLGGAVVWASDESFAEKENLILPTDAGHRPATFGPRGQIYDGWETRRRRQPGCDEAIVRLGVPGVVRGVVVDTAWFTGNHPTEVTVEAAAVDGHPSPDDVRKAEWHTLVARSPVGGDTRTPFAVDSETRWTHVKLTIHPDGGVARLRVHGEGRPDLDLLDRTSLDLAALENGALVTACSNGYYGAPQGLLFPGPVRTMGEGWETSRRRDDGNDWVQVRLAGTGVVRMVELDTSCFLGNAPGAASLRGRRPDGEWHDLLPRTVLQPDTRHRFLVDTPEPVTDVRLDIFPDGGMARLRVHGALL